MQTQFKDVLQQYNFLRQSNAEPFCTSTLSSDNLIKEYCMPLNRQLSAAFSRMLDQSIVFHDENCNIMGQHVSACLYDVEGKDVKKLEEFLQNLGLVPDISAALLGTLVKYPEPKLLPFNYQEFLKTTLTLIDQKLAMLSDNKNLLRHGDYTLNLEVRVPHHPRFVFCFHNENAVRTIHNYFRQHMPELFAPPPLQVIPAIVREEPIPAPAPAIVREEPVAAPQPALPLEAKWVQRLRNKKSPVLSKNNLRKRAQQLHQQLSNNFEIEIEDDKIQLKSPNPETINELTAVLEKSFALKLDNARTRIPGNYTALIVKDEALRTLLTKIEVQP